VKPEDLVLVTAFRHVLKEANQDTGFESFSRLTRHALSYDSFSEAVASCVAQGLIRDPVRLEEGALQCHWRLELTPKGVELARGVQSREGLSSHTE
jgi:hypothetical protein